MVTVADFNGKVKPDRPHPLLNWGSSPKPHRRGISRSQ